VVLAFDNKKMEAARNILGEVEENVLPDGTLEMSRMALYMRIIEAYEDIFAENLNPSRSVIVYELAKRLPQNAISVEHAKVNFNIHL
jgi:hypothetical protein